MKSRCTIRRCQAAYTMVELMAAVLISIILMIAMYQIFARVQKVFTEGNHRGKMYEEGRAVMDLIVRDLGQIAPSGEYKDPFQMNSAEWGFNPASTYDVPPTESVDYHPFYGCNFMAWPYAKDVLQVDVDLPAGFSDPDTPLETKQGWEAAISEPLVSSRVEFYVQDIEWRVMGYRLYSRNSPVSKNTQIIGALWRYESSPGLVNVLDGKALALRSNGESLYQKLSDNVIHFRMRAVSRDDPTRVLWGRPIFDGHNVPLYVEVELGIIEERLKKEILNDAEVEQYDVILEADAGDWDAWGARKGRIMKLLALNTDRILMLRQIVSIPGN